MLANADKAAESDSLQKTWRDFVLAAPVVALITVLSWQSIDMLRAENLLHRAALAAAREATLPKASCESVAAAVSRALRGSSLDEVVDRPIVTVNGQSVLHHPLDRLQSGDQVEVTLGAYATDVVPDSLRPIGLSLSWRRLIASASCLKP